MTVEFKKAERSQKPLKIGIKGPSGCGKTYSALLLAQGLVPDSMRIAVIDSEDGGANMYDSIDFDVVQISSQATGADYQEAMEVALSAGYGIVIIDSMSHDWEQVIEKESTIPAQDMKSWSLAKKQTGHAEFLRYLWKYPLDVICTIRCDEAFEVVRGDKGQTTKRKLGMKPIQQPRLEYNFDLVFDVESDTHISNTGGFGKSRIPLFQGERFVITQGHGKQIRDWKHGGAEWVEPMRKSTKEAITRYGKALNDNKWKRYTDDEQTHEKNFDDLSEPEAKEVLKNYIAKSKEKK